MSKPGPEIVDPAFYERHGYPHQAWRWLRENEPVAWIEPPGMKPFWAITRHADLEAIARDVERFTITPRMAVFPEAEYSSESFPYRHLINMDPPEHGQYRGLMTRRFTPKALAPTRETVGAIVDRALDGLRGRTEVDFVETVAAPIPLEVICEMLGVPPEDRPWLFRASNVLVGGSDPEIAAGLSPTEAVGKAVEDVFDYFRRLAAARRGHEGDDLITLLANAEIDGAPVGDWELVSYAALLIVAGNETTRNATTGGLLALLDNPAELDKLRQDPTLIPSAVEEIVRWVSPVIQFCRTARVDLEIGGTAIRAGDACCLFFPSANRDEEAFEAPDTFRVEREPNEHYGFGIGVHYCLGANLARLQLQEIFTRLVARLDDVEITAPPERVRSSFVGGVKRLPIRYHLR